MPRRRKLFYVASELMEAQYPVRWSALGQKGDA